MPSLFSENAVLDFLHHGNLMVALLSTLVAGFLTALSPCVYPIIPITLSVIGARRYASALQGFLVSLCYVSGMVVLYVGLGILFASLGILFGDIFRLPLVLIGIGILFVFFALSMFGATNWLLPQSMLTKLSQFGGSGYKGAFLMGLVSGLIASPCTGPVLAFILTLISQEGDLAKGSLLMLSFGIGMGFPFLLLGTFSSFLSRLPKSGLWMNRIKFVFGIIMLVAGGYFIQLGVKAHFGKTESTNPSAFVSIGFSDNAGAQLDQALAGFAKERRFVMIDFYADWCVACGELEKITFQDAAVKARLNQYGLIRVDLSRSNAALSAIEKRFGIVGLPLLVFYDKQGQLLTTPRVFGFMTPSEFLMVLDKVEDQ